MALRIGVIRGALNKEGLIMDVITNTTEYCKNPILEVIYDEGFSRTAPYLFEYGEGANQ